MKTTRIMNASADEVESLIRHLADEDAGKKAHSGMVYTKPITGMNGRTRVVDMKIMALEPSNYAVCFMDGNNQIHMSYTWKEKEPGKTEVCYEERSEWKTMRETLNQKIVSFLFGLTAKKQVSRRLDAFEQLLEGMAWQD